MSQRPHVSSEGTKKLFRTGGQQELFGERSVEEDHEQLVPGAAKPRGDGLEARRPVECLGITFESEEARRAYFTDRLREELQDPAFRQQPGFPLGSDEDILRLSDPPYYTACPNPFLAEFVRHFGKAYDPNASYRVEPLAVDVSEGKTDPLYKAHGYHTKVPHLAIVPPILHYTEPGDVVLDGFAGSGMTGVAAQWCGVAPEAYRRTIEAQFEAEGRPKPRWGTRRVIVNDLSPAATFIAANYNLSFDVSAFQHAVRGLLRDVERDLGWMYETRHTDGRAGRIEYTVWSEVFTCPDCSQEIVFLEQALDPASKRVRERFSCPQCRAQLSKDSLQRVKEASLDPSTGEVLQRVKFVPVLINYSIGKVRYEKKPDALDRAALEQVAHLPLPSSVPTDAFPIERMYHGSRLEPKGFTHVHHLFTPRAMQLLGSLWQGASRQSDIRIRNALKIIIIHQVVNASLMNRYRPASSFGNAPLGGVYYVSSLVAEANIFNLIRGSVTRIERMASWGWQNLVHTSKIVAVSTGDCANISIGDSSIDYIFTDPPFGENIYYADLNLMDEAWLGVRTDAAAEAIVDRAKKKDLAQYQDRMRACLAEYRRVLKPGRWMTMVFHNSHNSVWNAIQEAVLEAGFVVADVRTMDKQQGSYRQVTSSAMKQDLIVSAYRPSTALEERLRLGASSPEDAWAFVREHLRQLPRFVPAGDSRAETIAERRAYMLYDRVVAFFVERGLSVPLSAGDFHAGLAQRFPERDGMYFLPDQVAEYDLKRLTIRELLQLQFIVTDEASAIQWLRQELERKPQTLQELTPKFLKEISAWSKYEQRLELSGLLSENFLRQPGASPIAAQVLAWMKKSADLREKVRAAEAVSEASDGDLHTSEPQLLAAAKDHWYVPDPNRMQDLEKLRERELLEDFGQYKAFTGRQLKMFRLEAVRAGFKKAWAEKDYSTILAVAAKIPENVLQEDQKLLMWYDQAQTRAGA